MADWKYKSSFLQGIHVRIDTKIDISISIKTITTKFHKQILLEELTQIRLIKQVLMTSSCEYHVTNHYQNAYGYQTCQDGDY